MRRVMLLSSVHVGAVRDLAALWRTRLGLDVTVVAAVTDAGWRTGRGGGRIVALLVRLRGLLFPLVAGLPSRRDPAVLVATTNPFWLPWAVSLRRPHSPLVTLVYDVYPDAIEARWPLPAPVRRLVAHVVASGLERSASVVVLGERVGRELTARWSIEAPMRVIPTGVDPVVFATAPDRSADFAGIGPGDVVLSYVGNTGSMHDGATLGVALARLLTEHPIGTVAVVATRGDRAAELLDPLRSVSNAFLTSDLDDDAWAWLMRRSDIALVTLDARAGIASMPSKVYAALAAGCAVLAVAPASSDLAELVRSTGAGRVVEPGDVDAAHVALTELVVRPDVRAEHGAAARAAAERFTPDMLALQWSEVLRPLLGPDAPRRAQ
jgi:glycosyltransferase involved in cell wall biosynthesis